jgi:hypothetical protein
MTGFREVVRKGAMMLTFLRFGHNTDQTFGHNPKISSAVFKPVNGITILNALAPISLEIPISTSDHTNMDKVARDAIRTTDVRD